MFSLFQDNSPEAEKKRAEALFEKIVASKSDTREARSLRIRMGLLCRAHLDKTFIAGAELTAQHETLAKLAVARSQEPPPAPEAAMFQLVNTGKAEVYVYLPQEYAEVAFSLGAKYQKTEITAEKAIEAMQGLANQICLYELRLDEPFQVLQFLRDELAGGESDDAASPAAGPQTGEPAAPA